MYEPSIQTAIQREDDEGLDATSETMSHQLRSLVWFLLVDSDGQPGMGNRAFSVSRSAIYDMTDFCAAVTTKYTQGHLRSVSPLNLQVYKNKATFLDGTYGPFETSEPLRGLGLLEADALVVRVLRPSRQPVQPASVLPCKIPFFNNLSNCVERNGWLVFDDNMPPLSTLKSLYIRESFVSIAGSLTSIKRQL